MPEKRTTPTRPAATDKAVLEDQLLRLLIDYLPEALFVKDLTGRFILANKAAANLLGAATPELLLGRTDFDIYPTERAVQFREEEAAVRTGRTLMGNEEAITDRLTGKVSWVRTTKAPLLDPAGAVVAVVGVIRDVSERRRAAGHSVPSDVGTWPEDGRLGLEAILERERSLLRTVIDAIPAKIYAKDAQSRFIACNVLVARDMGTTAAEAIGKTDFDFFPAPMAQGFLADEQAVIQSGRALIEREELVLDRVTGEVRQISTTKVPFRDAAGNISGIIGIGRDITDRKRAEERIRYLASHDSLTELPNRATFSEVLNATIRSAHGSGARFAILFVDLDHFKLINDSLGHDAGDAVLKQTASRLRESVRSADSVARLGGDEFVVLCQDAPDLENLGAVALNILRAVNRPIVLLKQECRVSASIGVAMYPADGDTERVLMKSADTAMYTAKQEGKNTYRFFSSRLRADTLERTMLENELRHAIERNELRIYYLPKFDLRSRTITGAEARVSWSRADLGIIPPSQFLPLAEETGLIIPIGSWVLRTVCAQHIAWQREGLPPMCISVNLTSRQFNDERFVSSVMAALEESGMASGMLELEFAESLLMQDPARTSRILGELKHIGVRLAIDNFGASYLSLASIERFPIDILKVDRSLLRDIDQAESRAITDAIIAVGKSLSLTVIADGVETVRQAAFAREHACDALQGFYVSEPAGAADFGNLLRRQAEMHFSRSVEKDE